MTVRGRSTGNWKNARPTTYVPAYSFAMISNGLGNNEAALRWLATSVAEHEVQATFIKVDTRWDRLRPDPRFVALLQLVHLAQ